MLINLIVASITALAVGFVLLWLLLPSMRGPIEAPKYDVAEWDR
jgi:hypothetical protein